eukprot:224936_1
MFNSRVFGHPLFCMGLSYRHLKKFENQRLWGVILSENIPQLVIQGLFVWRKDMVLSLILILAFASSILSVIVALIDIYNNKRLFGKHAERYDYQTVLKVPVISHEVGLKQWKLCLATHRFNEVFSKIIGVDKYAIEVDLPAPHPNGLVIVFSVRSITITPKQIMEAMTRAQKNGAMAKFIGEAWHLEEDPVLGSIKVDQIGRKTDDLIFDHDDAPVEEVNPLNSDAKTLETLEEQNAVNAVMIDPNRWDIDERSNAVDAKPYEPLDTVTRAKLAMKKREQSRSQSEQSNNNNNHCFTDTSKQTSSPIIPEGEEMHEIGQVIVNTEDVEKAVSADMEGTNNVEPAADAVGDSDIPQNIAATQVILKKQSQSELPRQKTGTHTKNLIQMMQTDLRSNDLVAKGGSINTAVSRQPVSYSGQRNKAITDHVSQFRQQLQQYGAPSVPNLLHGNAINQRHTQSSTNFNRTGNANNPYQNYAQSSTNFNAPSHRGHTQTYGVPFTYQQQQLPQVHQNQQVMPPHHGHAQTYNQVPFNYQQIHQQPLPPQPQVDLTAQFQQQAQRMQQHGGYAASAFNLGRNNNNNFAQQQFQQNAQMYSASAVNMNEEPVVLRKITDHEHESFLPPAPNQEMDKYVEWKMKRQMLDEEKKVRKKQAKEQKRLEREPNLSKISSLNATDVDRQQWSQMNANIGFDETVTNANYNNAAFANKLVHHGESESNQMDDILSEMDSTDQMNQN